MEFIFLGSLVISERCTNCRFLLRSFTKAIKTWAKVLLSSVLVPLECVHVYDFGTDLQTVFETFFYQRPEL